MSNQPKEDGLAAVTLPGTVEKIIPAIGPNEPEKAQIAVEGADELYQEIRVENTSKSKAGDALIKAIEAALQGDDFVLVE